MQVTHEKDAELASCADLLRVLEATQRDAAERATAREAALSAQLRWGRCTCCEGLSQPGQSDESFLWGEGLVLLRDAQPRGPSADKERVLQRALPYGKLPPWQSLEGYAGI